ncbi:MAG: FkbM family methyltransferase [Selenomonas sp.]|nr:FkbM family methyltransferase [Selenomonas sp.]
MKKRFRRLEEEWALPSDRLVAVQAGVSDTPSHASLAGGAMSDNLIGTRLVESGDEDAIAIVTLDEALKNQRVDFLKADIEGYEMAMLRGAEHLIRTQKPRIAICLYHKLTDPYEIPLYLRELVPEYHFKVRQHAMNFTECVLYAYCL